MIVYEETVRLRSFMSPLREVAIIATALAFGGYVYWSEFSGGRPFHPLAVLIPAAVVAFEIFPVLLILNGAFFPGLCLQVDEKSLTLKRGFIRKKILLESIVEVSPVSASRVKKTTVLQYLYQSTDFLFLDRKDLPNVELLLSGGQSKYVATARPEDLARTLSYQIECAQRESALRMVAAHSLK